MAETNISYCEYSWSGWYGCQHVHAGCANCFAESWAKRYGRAKWGPNGTRVKASDAYWRKPLKWNREAVKQTCQCCDNGFPMVGTTHIPTQSLGMIPNTECRKHRPRVLWDLSDPFEDWRGVIINSQKLPIMDEDCQQNSIRMDTLRNRVFQLIDATPNLDWLLLTKRPENIRQMWPKMDNQGNYWHKANVWLGCSVSDQRTADTMIPEMLRCRDLSPCLWVSVEPMIGPVDLDSIWPGGLPSPGSGPYVPGIDWVVIGGESGPNRRQCEVQWIRNVREQCRAAGVACYVKQDSALKPGQQGRIPDDLWEVKEFPNAECTSLFVIANAERWD